MSNQTLKPEMIIDERLARNVAAQLLEIEAVFLRPDEPFTWASGMKSPIYCDNRLTMSYPKVRDMIRDGFVNIVKESFSDVEVIAGTATAGIPHAAWLAQKLKLPMIYIRSGSKAHGRENKIEGLLKAGQKVLVIEDLISTGGSSIEAAQAVQESGGDLLGVAAIFSYGFEKATKAFAEASIPFTCLSNYSLLLEIAQEKKIIKQDQLGLLAAWRQDPSSYGA